MTTNSPILENIENIKTQYYAENSKNRFFKNSQKQECANVISNNVDLNELLKITTYIIPGTNRVYFNYLVFKLYANHENENQIVNYVLELFNQCIVTYGIYECHVNLDSFTVTAAQRYKSVVEIFYNNCSEEMTSHLKNMVIYNTPGMIDNLVTVLRHAINPEIKRKAVFVSKKESESKILEIHDSLN
jgi:hypothetical protein